MLNMIGKLEDQRLMIYILEATIQMRRIGPGDFKEINRCHGIRVI